MSAAGAFAALHDGPAPLLLPNAWDVASALALVAGGHPAVGTTSLGVAAAAGIPDASRAGLAATVDLARSLARLPVPVTVDLADGFADDPAEVAALVVGLPAAGVNLEDGTGGRLVDPALHAAKVAAVAEAAPGVFLNARVDTYWLGEDADLTTTLARARRYVAAGADGVFVPGRLGEAEIAVLTSELPVPVNVLAGAHPLHRLAELGVRRVSTGSLLFRAALDAAVAVAARLRDGEAAPPATPYAEVEARTAAYGG
ncbi:isocitrate lyase/phosphoenolpyruvate mutase family protein [Geodermatophilus normandii]|uniref:isocitrate lyase/phosphoenolpyruvate mutase family protein n=1 Tax=Geodermatophilus normandii TaxID=1137989 RepID=UPI001953E0ED